MLVQSQRQYEKEGETTKFPKENLLRGNTKAGKSDTRVRGVGIDENILKKRADVGTKYRKNVLENGRKG